MMWMPAPDEATCQTVAHAIYRLTRPVGSMASDITRYAFGWRQATDGSWWMEWHNDMVLPVHSERGPELAQILAGFVAGGYLAQASADAVLALAASREGSTVTLAEVTPPEWAALMLDEQQAAGLWLQTQNP